MKKQPDFHELDETLKSVDKESQWAEEGRNKVKQRIFHDLEKKERFFFSKKGTSLKYYLSLTAAAFLLFILLVPVLPFFDHAQESGRGDAAQRYSDEIEGGFYFNLQRIEEQGDGYAVTLFIENTNEEPFNIQDNEIFIKSFDKSRLDEVDGEWVKHPEDQYVDTFSVLIEVDVLEGSFEVVEPGENTTISFFVPKEYIDNNNFELMYQSKVIPSGNYRGNWPGVTYHVIDLHRENIALYDEGDHNSNVLVPYLLSIFIITGLLFVTWKYSNSTKRKTILSATIITLAIISHFTNIALKDDIVEIKKETNQTTLPMMDVVHVEMLSNNEALAFYEHGGGTISYFGRNMLQKNLFGWRNIGGSSYQITQRDNLHWGFSNLSYSSPNFDSLISGRLFNDEVVEVIVVVNNQEEKAKIVEYRDGERFWFYLSEVEDLSNSVPVYGVNENGDILEQYPPERDN
ncbi:hypothetical protein ACERII_00535 [Evansella sp. AB-rgal1]|uniref:hypothetical protein n=1 Tax=Evansella sp. AB-rgal1 TaxID=3242696 RepID=UPI00359DA6A1